MSHTLSALLLAVIAIAPAGAMAQSRGLAQITQAQAAKIDSALRLDGSNKALNQAVTEAAANIGPFLKAHSCMTAYDASGLNVFAAPGKNYPNNNYIKGPMPKMYKHNKASCVDVARIHGWKMAGANALRFEVVYVSELSGESGKSKHEVQKQASGERLFTR